MTATNTFQAAGPVLHIAPTPFFSNRGCHIRIRNEIEALQSAGQRVILCTYHHGRDIAGIDIRRIPTIPGYSQTEAGFSPYKFLADMLLFWLVLRVAVTSRPRLLHGHLHEGALIGWAVAAVLFWRRLPVVMDMQGSLSGELAAYGTFAEGSPVLAGFRWLEAVICRLPNFVLCSSVAAQRCLVDEFAVSRRKAALLADVVPQVFFQPADRRSARRALGLPEDRPIAIYTGSLLRGKGVEYALEAMRLLVQDAGAASLFFVFVGYPEAPVTDFVGRHRLSDRCRVAGEVVYDQLPQWLAAADMAIEPKAAAGGEASGKLLHYMAAGLPVVGFDTPANRSLLGDLGFWVTRADAQGMARQLRHLLLNPEAADKRGREGRLLAQRRHSPTAAAQVLQRTYAQLTK